MNSRKSTACVLALIPLRPRALLPGAFGFLTFTQCGERAERQGEPSRSERGVSRD
jgi:hypothetical protein